MPQFDFFTFSTQIFWSILIFYSFYFIFTQIYLPKISETIKLREKRKRLQQTVSKTTLFSTIFLFLF